MLCSLGGTACRASPYHPQKWQDILREVKFLKSCDHESCIHYKACYLKDHTCWVGEGRTCLARQGGGEAAMLARLSRLKEQTVRKDTSWEENHCGPLAKLLFFQ